MTDAKNNFAQKYLAFLPPSRYRIWTYAEVDADKSVSFEGRVTTSYADLESWITDTATYVVCNNDDDLLIIVFPPQPTDSGVCYVQNK